MPRYSAELIKKECPVCKKIYLANVRRVANNRDMFCSRECSYLARGIKHRKEIIIWTDEYKRAYNKQYRKDNIEKIKFLNRLWIKNNLERNKELNKKERVRLKMDVYNHYAKNGIIECGHCGYKDIRALDIDHIDDKGAEHRIKLFGKRTLAGTTFYRWLRTNKYPSGFQILCRNCNWIKKLNADNTNTLQIHSKNISNTNIKSIG